MSRQSEGPKSPTPEEVDQLVDVVNDCITLAEQDPTAGSQKKLELSKQLERLVEVLDWAGEQVSKRRLYSKKFQLKDKARTQLLRERLGEGYDEIVAQAKVAANDRLFEEVANGKPDRE